MVSSLLVFYYLWDIVCDVLLWDLCIYFVSQAVVSHLESRDTVVHMTNTVGVRYA